MTHTPFVEHIFKGVCICSCKDCTERVPQLKPVRDKDVYQLKCTCPDCNGLLCGLRNTA